MQTQLASEYQGTPDGDAAEAILRRCVHCGFCTATCPTYQLLGDELDGPRGRIYLIKQVLEGTAPTRKTQEHLDRCLTCRNCETTCPSGVQYGQLIDIGRRLVDAKVERPAAEQRTRWMLREGMTSAGFGTALKLGQAIRPLLPSVLKSKVPPRVSPERQVSAHRWPTRSHDRKVLMLLGCVQPSLAPNINSATARVLDACGIQTLVADEVRCCGAVRAHLGDQDKARAEIRRNIDAWWPLVEGVGGGTQVEAIVVNASACGLMVKEYGHLMADDAAYAERAKRISATARDISELLPMIATPLKSRLGGRLPAGMPKRLSYHPPCTLQHGQKLRGGVESALTELGFDVRLAARDSHLCCGSAGTYSILQPALSMQLRDRKLSSLIETEPQTIVSANIGCIQHLQSGTNTPVRHWIEVLDDLIGG